MVENGACRQKMSQARTTSGLHLHWLCKALMTLIWLSFTAGWCCMCCFLKGLWGLPFKVNKALRDAPKLPQDLRFKRVFVFWPELIRSYNAKLPWFSRSIPHTLFLEWLALLIWEDLFGPVESGAWQTLALGTFRCFSFLLWRVIQQCNVQGCLIIDVVDSVVLVASCSKCSRHSARYACNSASKHDVAQSSSESPIKDWTRS